MNIFYSISNNNFLAKSYGYLTIQGQIINKYDIIKNQPSIYINDDDDQVFYSLLLINISNSFLHWWIANIDPKNDYSEEWVPYYMNEYQTENIVSKGNNSNMYPIPKDKIDHFVFYLYKHNEILEKSNIINSFIFRKNFKLIKWVNTYNLKILSTKFFNRNYPHY